MLSPLVHAIAVGLLISQWTYTSSCIPVGPPLQDPVASAANAAVASTFDFSILTISGGSFLDPDRTIASLQGFLARVDLEISIHCPSCPIPRDTWILNDDYLELESYANAVYPPLPEDWTWQTLKYIVVEWLEWANEKAAQPQSLQESYFFVDTAGESTRAVHVVSGSLKRFHPGAPPRPPTPPDVAVARIVSAGSERNATTDPISITSRSLDSIKRATVTTNTTALTAPSVSDLNLGLYLDPLQAAVNIPQFSVVSLVENILQDIERAADASQPLPNPSYSQSSGLVKLSLQPQGLEGTYWTYGVLEWFGSQLLKQGGKTDSLLESSVRILDNSGGVYPYPGKLVVTGSLALATTIVVNATPSTAIVTANDRHYDVLLTPIRDGLRIPRSSLLSLSEKILYDVERSPGVLHRLPGTSYSAKSELLELNLVGGTTRIGQTSWTYGMLEIMCGVLLEKDGERGFLQESKVDIVTSVLVATGSLSLTSHKSAGGTNSPVNEQSAPLQLASEKRATPVVTNTTALIALNESVPNLRLELTDRYRPETIPRLAFRFLVRQIFEELAGISDLSAPIAGDTWQDDTEYIYLTLEKAPQGADEFWTYEMLDFVVEKLLSMSEAGPRLRESEMKVLNMDEGSPGRTVATGTLLLYPRSHGISPPGNEQDATARVDVTSRSMEAAKRSSSHENTAGIGGDPNSGSAHDDHTTASIALNDLFPNFRLEVSNLPGRVTIPRLALHYLVAWISHDNRHATDPSQPLPSTSYSVDTDRMIFLRVYRVNAGEAEWTYGFLDWLAEALLQKDEQEGPLPVGLMKIQDIRGQGRYIASGVLLLSMGADNSDQNDTAKGVVSLPNSDQNASTSRVDVTSRSLDTINISALALAIPNISNIERVFRLSPLLSALTIPHPVLVSLVMKMLAFVERGPGHQHALPAATYSETNQNLDLFLRRVGTGGMDWTYGMLMYVSVQLLASASAGVKESSMHVYQVLEGQRIITAAGVLLFNDRGGASGGELDASSLMIESSLTTAASTDALPGAAALEKRAMTLPQTNASALAAANATTTPDLSPIRRSTLLTRIRSGQSIPHPGLLLLMKQIVIFIERASNPDTRLPGLPYIADTDLLEFTLMPQGSAGVERDWTYGMLAYVCGELLLASATLRGLGESLLMVYDGVWPGAQYVASGLLVLKSRDQNANATTAAMTMSNTTSTTTAKNASIAAAVAAAAFPLNTTTIKPEYVFTPLRNPFAIPGQSVLDLLDQIFHFIGANLQDAPLPDPSYTWKTDQVELMLFREGPAAAGGDGWTYGILTFLCFRLHYLSTHAPGEVLESSVQLFDVVGEGRPNVLVAFGFLATNSGSGNASAAAALNATNTTLMSSSSSSNSNSSGIDTSTAALPSSSPTINRDYVLTPHRNSLTIPHQALLDLAGEIVDFIGLNGADTLLAEPSYTWSTDQVQLIFFKQEPAAGSSDWTYGMLAYLCYQLYRAGMSPEEVLESFVEVFDVVGGEAQPNVLVGAGALMATSGNGSTTMNPATTTLMTSTSNSSSSSSSSTGADNTTTTAGIVAAAGAAATVTADPFPYLITFPPFPRSSFPRLIPRAALLALVQTMLDFIERAVTPTGGRGVDPAKIPLPNPTSYTARTDQVQLTLNRQRQQQQTDWNCGMLTFVAGKLLVVASGPEVRESGVIVLTEGTGGMPFGERIANGVLLMGMRSRVGDASGGGGAVATT